MHVDCIRSLLGHPRILKGYHETVAKILKSF